MKRARDDWKCLEGLTMIEDEDVFYFCSPSQNIGYCHRCLSRICNEYTTQIPAHFRHEEQKQWSIDLEFGDDIPCESGDCWYQRNMERLGRYKFSERCRNLHDQDMWICDNCLEGEDLSVCHTCRVRVVSVVHLNMEGISETLCKVCIKAALSYWDKIQVRKRYTCNV